MKFRAFLTFFLVLSLGWVSCEKEQPANQEDDEIAVSIDKEELTFSYQTSCMDLRISPIGGQAPYSVALNDQDYQAFVPGRILSMPEVGLNRICIRDSVGTVSDTVITNAVPMLLAYSMSCATLDGAYLTLDYISCGEAPFFLFANDKFVNRSDEGWLLEPGENKLVFMDQAGRRSGMLDTFVEPAVDFVMDLGNVNASNGLAILHVQVSGGSEPYNVSLNGGLSYGATGAYYYPVYVGQTLSVLIRDQFGCVSEIKTIEI